MVMMAVIAVLMIMMIMVIMAVAIVSVMFMACVGVEQIRRSDCGADRGRAVQRPQRREESPPFDPQEPQTDNDDQGVAHGFDHVHGIVHGRCRRIEQRCGDAYHHHCEQRLDQCRSERQHDAPPPSLPEIRRDHRLAVAGSGGVKNPIEERQSEQAPGGMAVGPGVTLVRHKSLPC